MVKHGRWHVWQDNGVAIANHRTGRLEERVHVVRSRDGPAFQIVARHAHHLPWSRNGRPESNLIDRRRLTVSGRFFKRWPELVKPLHEPFEQVLRVKLWDRIENVGHVYDPAVCNHRGSVVINECETHLVLRIASLN